VAVERETKAVGPASRGRDASTRSRPEENAGRDESEAERIDRNLRELMEELRVAVIGAQVLFAFLLALPFTTRFGETHDWQRALYVIDLLLAAFATALLIAPVAYHRMVFRRHAKRKLLFRANTMAVTGLCTIGIAISGSLLLVVSVIYSGAIVPILTGACALAIFGLWFVFPSIGDQPDDY
jgi:uncharacterized membrane protein YbhN (UPF0104 family)